MSKLIELNPSEEVLDGFDWSDEITDHPFPGDDETLFHDTFLDICFRISPGVISTATKILNCKLHKDGKVSIAMWYRLLGYPICLELALSAPIGWKDNIDISIEPEDDHYALKYGGLKWLR